MRYSRHDLTAFLRYLVGLKPRIGDCYYTKEDYAKLIKHRLLLRKHRPYSCHPFRITHYYKVNPLGADQPEEGGKACDSYVAKLHNERRAELRAKGVIGSLVYCNADEATFVAGAGVCGSIRAIKDLVVTRTVIGVWSKEMIDDANARSARYAKEDAGARYFTALYVTSDGRTTP